MKPNAIITEINMNCHVQYIVSLWLSALIKAETYTYIYHSSNKNRYKLALQEMFIGKLESLWNFVLNNEITCRLTKFKFNLK